MTRIIIGHASFIVGREHLYLGEAYPLDSFDLEPANDWLATDAEG